MYDLYVQSKNRVTVGAQTYRNIFYKNFNLGFHKPKKDRCETCIFLQNSKETDKEKVDKLNEEYREHQVNKTMARYLKNSYKLMLRRIKR